jgi:hypothetical protein
VTWGKTSIRRVGSARFLPEFSHLRDNKKNADNAKTFDVKSFASGMKIVNDQMRSFDADQGFFSGAAMMAA